MLAAKVGRPLRWRETRSESMMALGHGRGQVQYVTVGGTRDGKVTHYQLHVIQDAGYFAEMGTILAPFMTRPMASAVYDIPNIEVRTTSVVTNTAVTTAYRGAGRPEATAAAERAMDLFAAELGMDPAEVRRINLIPKFLEPHTTAVGQTYDVGDYETALDKALAAAGYTELRAEQARRRASGDVEAAGHRRQHLRRDHRRRRPVRRARQDRGARRRPGRSSTPAPRRTARATSRAWSMLAHEQTGIPMDQIDVVWGDTDLVPEGAGTMGSRSLQHGGAAVWNAAVELVDKARKLAAKLLEADEADVVLDKDNGAFHVSGTPSIAQGLGRARRRRPRRRRPARRACSTRLFFQGAASFPFGSHVAVVEVDTETGKVRHCSATSPATTPAGC